MKNEIYKLQNPLNIHISSINILLTQHSLEEMNFASDDTAIDQLHSQERLENAQSIMEKMPEA